MKLGTYIVLKFTKGRGRHLIRSPYVVFKCDHCSKIGSRKFSDIRSDLHFCNRACADKNRLVGGETRTRIQVTREQRDPGLKKSTSRRSETLIHRYGSNRWTDVPGMVEKISSTTKTAMDAFATNEMFRSLEEKYGPGIRSTFQIESVLEKAKKTHFERYGCEYPAQVDGWGDRQRKVLIKTLKTRRTFSSKIEDEFASFLVEQGITFERQIPFQGRLIDFKISESLYIQFDGVYWHGLNRPLEELKKQTNSQAQSILRRFQIDREQDDLFCSLGLQLVRVTDQEFKTAKQTTNDLSHLLKQKGII